MEVLRPVLPGLRKKVKDGTPTLGICLGMQILFEKSEESRGEGVAVIKGTVRRLRRGRIPQMGWNEVVPKSDRLFEGVPEGSQFYFANSYICLPAEDVTIADTVYGMRFASAVRKGAILGVQFHPEKSGPPGLRLLGNFVRIAEESS
jgi:glutamine amidotransferase